MLKKFNKYFFPGLVTTILLTTLAIWFQGESKNIELAVIKEVNVEVDSK